MIKNKKLVFTVLASSFAVCKLRPEASIPKWAYQGRFISITKTEEEVSIVCQTDNIPEDVVCAKNWRALKIVAELDFSLVGILARISTVLANAGISIFAISTYNTDYILVKQEQLDKTLQTLLDARYEFI